MAICDLLRRTLHVTFPIQYERYFAEYTYACIEYFCQPAVVQLPVEGDIDWGNSVSHGNRKTEIANGRESLNECVRKGILI